MAKSRTRFVDEREFPLFLLDTCCVDSNNRIDIQAYGGQTEAWTGCYKGSCNIRARLSTAARVYHRSCVCDQLMFQGLEGGGGLF